MTLLSPRLIRGEERGATTMEFALIAPVLLVMVMGLFDLGYVMYTNSMLEGAIHKAARDSTIEGSTSRSAEIDRRVEEAVKAVVLHSTVAFSRKSYASFSDVARPEDFTDINNDGACNAGEPFEDSNGNGSWDQDRGNSGQGGARDAVLYTVTVTYDRPFPVANLIGQDETFSLKSQTVLRNQPYGMQAVAQPTMGNCA
ncbi:MAG: TadE/TadG family type IV pilus assembly protein [Novosphingobium sp.]